MNRQPKRILVVMPSWVGDVVMATPTLRALRAHRPDAHIACLTYPHLAELLGGNPWTDSTITWPVRGSRHRPNGLLAMSRRLHRQRFDTAILLPNSFRSALVVRLAGVPERVGYGRDGRSWLLTEVLDSPRRNGRLKPHPMCDYYGRLAMATGCSKPGDRLELTTDDVTDRDVEQRLASLGIRDHHPFVAISPGASFGSSKLWLPERFAELGDRLIESRRASVAITCGPGEEALARRIGALMKHRGFVLDHPLLTLSEFKSLIRRVDLLVNNDTGPRHIAKALSRPVVTIFGPTHQAWTDTNGCVERKIQIDVECGPCQLKTCPYEHHRCMTGVTVDMVYERSVELLDHAGVRKAS